MKQNDTSTNDRDNFMLIVLISGLAIYGILKWIGPDLKLWLFSFGVIAFGVALFFYSLSGTDYTEFRETTPREFYERNEHSIAVGSDFSWNVPIRLPDRIRTQHVQILGGSGTGKTASFILPAIAQDAAHKHPIIIVDGKADGSFLKFLTNIAEHHGRELLVFDLRGVNSKSYNPLGGLTPDDAANLLMNSFKWTEPYYESRSTEALKLICRNVKTTGAITAGKIQSYLESSVSFSALANSNMKSKEAPGSLRDWFADCSGLRAQLDSLNSGAHGALLNTDTPEIELFRDVMAGKIIYFRLPALADKNAALILGRLILNDIKRLASQLHASDTEVFCPVFIDEFAPFAIEDFATLFAMGRSAGIALHVSHQSLGDLETVSPSFASQVIDNTATKIFFRLGDDTTAEKAARLTGTTETEKVTRRANLAGSKPEMEDSGSLRDAHEFTYHPQIFKTLPLGQVILTSSHGKNTKVGGLLTRRLRVGPLNAMYSEPPKKKEEK